MSSNTIVRNGGEVIVEGSAHLVGAYVSEGGSVTLTLEQGRNIYYVNGAGAVVIPLPGTLEYESSSARTVLRALLEADPGNRAAREYLLCYELMWYNLDGFMETYEQEMIPGRVYREAILIWLSQQGQLNPEGVARYGVDETEVDRMGRFGQNPNAFKNTYWYYYLQAMEAQK